MMSRISVLLHLWYVLAFSCIPAKAGDSRTRRRILARGQRLFDSCVSNTDSNMSTREREQFKCFAYSLHGSVSTLCLAQFCRRAARVDSPEAPRRDALAPRRPFFWLAGEWETGQFLPTEYFSLRTLFDELPASTWASSEKME